ncbi:MAG: peptide-methionine (S)-S-oxide reductase MsrA [Spirochaetes bacterium]|jgi:peptide methionine sulfoxide reductase msrA/msrB|nr:peptide-methionine (S)-S-oxide reductase MsrA [Spirochaetota bacterium]
MENKNSSSGTERAVFAGGCFWGVEYYFDDLLGVISTMPGYTGGATSDPGYNEVCTGETGHVEAVEIVFNPEVVSYEDLTKLFFEIHDPSQANGQGPDIGAQYLSAIFYSTEKQKEIVENLITVLRSKGIEVVTSVNPLKKFWSAEEYHRKYYRKNGSKPYCHRRVQRF